MPRYQAANPLCCDRSILKSSDVGATLSFNSLPVRCQTWQWPAYRRTSQVHHRVRRQTSYAHKIRTGAKCAKQRHVYGMNGSTESRPQQQEQQQNGGGPDTSLLAEELQGQWHEKLNRHLGNVRIKPHSHRKVWWSCNQCPEGLPHVWEAHVHNRTQGTGCPFCSGTAVCQHNTLATKAPQVALFWDAKKNHPLSPDQVTALSNVRVHWKCSTCLHEWQAPVLSKAHGKSGCPKCARARGGRKADGTQQKHPTFAFAEHALLEQWDHDRNSDNGNFPDNTTLRSGKLIWWHCHECPKGKVHSWQASPNNRNGKTTTGCPCCVGRKLCECNSLETVCPDIAADFDIKKNGVRPAEVTSATQTKYTWLSDEPGAKKRSVGQRTLYTRKQSRQFVDVPDVCV
ncbi:TPA: hypothetical protein ACH3X1_014421 [Trebouxia sp. C0004]